MNKKDKKVTKREVLRMLVCKEYWLNEEEQKLINEYRQSVWNSKDESGEELKHQHRNPNQLHSTLYSNIQNKETK